MALLELEPVSARAGIVRLHTARLRLRHNRASGKQQGEVSVPTFPVGQPKVLGHKIEVTGVAVPANEAETDKNVPKAPHYMKLSGIKMVSTTCP